MDLAAVVDLANRVQQDLARLRTRSTVVVMFVDLVGSTSFKAKHPDEEQWLPRLAKFLLGVTRIVESDGRVVKYIGDEVMAVFEGEHAPMAAEQAAERILLFCEQMSNEDLQVKLAVDHGPVNLLDFSPPGAADLNAGRAPLQMSDPVGLVVDRCARIMSKSQAGAVLCSRQFKDACRAPDRWRQVGTFGAKGIPQPVEVYCLNTKGSPEIRIVDETMTLAECKAELVKVQSQLAGLKQLSRRPSQ